MLLIFVLSMVVWATGAKINLPIHTGKEILVTGIQINFKYEEYDLASIENLKGSKDKYEKFIYRFSHALSKRDVTYYRSNTYCKNQKNVDGWYKAFFETKFPKAISGVNLHSKGMFGNMAYFLVKYENEEMPIRPFFIKPIDEKLFFVPEDSFLKPNQLLIHMFQGIVKQPSKMKTLYPGKGDFIFKKEMEKKSKHPYSFEFPVYVVELDGKGEPIDTGSIKKEIKFFKKYYSAVKNGNFKKYFKLRHPYFRKNIETHFLGEKIDELFLHHHTHKRLKYIVKGPDVTLLFHSISKGRKRLDVDVLTRDKKGEYNHFFDLYIFSGNGLKAVLQNKIKIETELARQSKVLKVKNVKKGKISRK